MKTLYISDLDGTLLRSDERTSEYTNSVINKLTGRGMLFSYATARSISTSSKVTRGITARIPVVTYNGALTVDNLTHELLASNFFEKQNADGIIDLLFSREILPIVYAYIGGKERFSYVPEMLENKTAGDFIASRAGDERANPVCGKERLYNGDIFYFTCIDEEEKLEPVYNELKHLYRCFYQRETYSGKYWLEIIPKDVSKANAVLKLKERLGAKRIVAFGDNKNDIDMFRIADEAYAVSNAVEELKAVATGVIGSNDEDGVARWLEQNAEKRLCRF